MNGDFSTIESGKGLGEHSFDPKETFTPDNPRYKKVKSIILYSLFFAGTMSLPAFIAEIGAM